MTISTTGLYFPNQVDSHISLERALRTIYCPASGLQDDWADYALCEGLVWMV